MQGVLYMKKKRVVYFSLVCIVILLGLISRQLSFVPLFMGDLLWAVMMFFIVRFIFPERAPMLIVFISLTLCYAVEISQLYQAEWINSIRQTLPGRLILGQGFLWSDIVSYTLGILLALFFEQVKLLQGSIEGTSEN